MASHFLECQVGQAPALCIAIILGKGTDWKQPETSLRHPIPGVTGKTRSASTHVFLGFDTKSFLGEWPEVMRKSVLGLRGSGPGVFSFTRACSPLLGLCMKGNRVPNECSRFRLK